MAKLTKEEWDLVRDAVEARIEQLESDRDELMGTPEDAKRHLATTRKLDADADALRSALASLKEEVEGDE